MKKVALFLICVVPCLPLTGILVLLWRRQRPVQARPSESGGVWGGLPKQLLVQTNEHNEIEFGAPKNLLQDALSADVIDPKIISLSESPNIVTRGKFQQDRISAMCRKHFFSREQKLPSNPDQFFRHLMFDDKRKAIYCFVPKIGCTDMKRLMLYMGGHLPMKTIDWPWVEDKIYLEPALAKTSFLNKTLNLNEKMARLKDYYKFMIVRNPLERLVSAYRNKMEPLVSFKNRDKFPDSMKVLVLERYRSSELLNWRKSNGYGVKLNISVTFADFVRYFVETDVMKLNDHFQPSIDTCHPCIAKYDFYGNFRSYSSDVTRLISKFGTEQRFYRDNSLHSSADQTSKKMAVYYSRLTHQDKLKLLGKMYDDLLFYYTLYPADRHSHYNMLGIHHPII